MKVFPPAQQRLLDMAVTAGLARVSDDGAYLFAGRHSSVTYEIDTELLAFADAVRADNAARYAKLRRWMSSNVREGWSEVERLAALACYVGWDEFDAYLDALPECNVGLCQTGAPA